MFSIVKKVVLSTLSILGINLVAWTVFLLNPNLSYANETQVDNVTIYHNQALEEGTELIVHDALSIIQNADIYDEQMELHLCLNDDKTYPKLYPFAGGLAYAFLDKTVIYESTPNFGNNRVEFSWAVNDYEVRRWNLTALLAHEFTHNLQYHHDPNYYVMSTLGHLNWKFEGHAEYVSRRFKNDNRLKEKIETFLLEEKKEHVGIPVFLLEDGTIQNLAYFRYALVFQYLTEVQNLDFDEICKLDAPLADLYEEMIDWSRLQ
ncbi:MAG: hypothetical protein AAGA85_13315 [Bacteroidota bacterium]